MHYDTHHFDSPQAARAFQVQVFEDDLARMRRRLTKLTPGSFRHVNLSACIAEAEAQTEHLRAIARAEGAIT